MQRKVLLTVFVIFVVSSLVACGSTSSPTPRPVSTTTPGRTMGLVTGVVDGDTIDVEIAGQEYRVRYIGMNTPERDELFYKEATEANRQLVLGKTVELEKDVSETDRYGRLLRYVYVNDLFVNAHLVEQGYAQVLTYPPDVKYQELFLQLQRQAREAGRGLWSVLEPTVQPGQPVAGDVIISYIYNASKVEYVTILNRGEVSHDIGGWTLQSDNNPDIFTFPEGFALPAGGTVKVHSGSECVQNPPTDFCWVSKALWSNKSDSGTLRDAAGNAVSTYGY